MYDAMTPQEHPAPGVWPGPYRPLIGLLVAILAALAGMGVCAAAILVPAPAPAVPFALAIVTGCPLLAGWEIRFATSRSGSERSGDVALTRFRSQLARLPETKHPLGL
jgi:hypothetical protein